MARMWLLGAAASLAMIGGTASAQEGAPACPHAADIPSPAPVAVALAGADEPDLVRFFSARGPLFGPQISPDGRTAALFVTHGANDPRDPVAESDRLVSIVRENGGDVTYMRFVDEGHGIRRLANRIHVHKGIADFLNRTLIEAPATPAPPVSSR